MGKKNKGGNNRPQRPSWFKQQEQRMGLDFLNKMHAEDIRKNSLKIFKDLAEGNINPDDANKYFNNYDFTYNLMIAAQDNLNYRMYVYQGLINNPQIQYDEQMQRVASEVNEQITAYNSILVHLNNILYNITMYNGMYTSYCLQQLIAGIRWKKNAFNGFFITLPRETDRRNKKPERRQINNHDKGFHNQNEGGFFNKSS